MFKIIRKPREEFEYLGVNKRRPCPLRCWCVAWAAMSFPECGLLVFTNESLRQHTVLPFDDCVGLVAAAGASSMILLDILLNRSTSSLSSRSPRKSSGLVNIRMLTRLRRWIRTFRTPTWVMLDEGWWRHASPSYCTSGTPFCPSSEPTRKSVGIWTTPPSAEIAGAPHRYIVAVY